MRKYSVVIIITAILLFSGCISSDDDEDPLASAKERTIALVHDAVDAINADGPAVFPEFRVADSPWYQDDMYVFVWRTDGLRVVYPPDSEGEGKDMSSLVDSNETPIGQLFIEAATTDPYEGWVTYYWPKPGETQPEPKQTYIMKASYESVDYLVGSGFYVTDYAEDED